MHGDNLIKHKTNRKHHHHHHHINPQIKTAIMIKVQNQNNKPPNKTTHILQIINK